MKRHTRYNPHHHHHHHHIHIIYPNNPIPLCILLPCYHTVLDTRFMIPSARLLHICFAICHIYPIPFHCQFRSNSIYPVRLKKSNPNKTRRMTCTHARTQEKINKRPVRQGKLDQTKTTPSPTHACLLCDCVCECVP
jgi:hypothetical protein